MQKSTSYTEEQGIKVITFVQEPGKTRQKIYLLPGKVQFASRSIEMAQQAQESGAVAVIEVIMSTGHTGNKSPSLSKLGNKK